MLVTRQQKNLLLGLSRLSVTRRYIRAVPFHFLPHEPNRSTHERLHNPTFLNHRRKMLNSGRVSCMSLCLLSLPLPLEKLRTTVSSRRVVTCRGVDTINAISLQHNAIQRQQQQQHHKHTGSRITVKLNQ